MNRTIYQRGFTLIELLVVISIIGLLASVVLSSVSSARTKGQNAARLSQVDQYRTALGLYYAKNGSYPDPGKIIDPSAPDMDCTTCSGGATNCPGYTDVTCLGSGYPGGVCQFGYISELPAFDALLTPFIPGAPPILPNSPISIPDFGADYYGATYNCAKRKNGLCTTYVIGYALSGTNQTCLNGYVTPSGWSSSASICYLVDGDISGFPSNIEAASLCSACS